MLVGAAAVSIRVKLPLGGITRVVWGRRTRRRSVIHVDVRLRGQPVHVRPLLRLHLVRDGCVPGAVALVLRARKRRPGLLESSHSHGSWHRRRPVALPVGAGLPWGVGAQEYRESGDAVDGPLQRGDLGEPLAAEVMVQSDAQGIEGLVVVHDALPLADVCGHSSRL